MADSLIRCKNPALEDEIWLYVLQSDADMLTVKLTGQGQRFRVRRSVGVSYWQVDSPHRACDGDPLEIRDECLRAKYRVLYRRQR